MKRTYLFLTLIGFILPNILVAKVGIETGNILLWTDMKTTMAEMFANDISTIFIIDLFFLVFLFLIWSYREAQKHQIKWYWLTWIWTFAFGLASGLPLFLYLRERTLEISDSNF
jgi:hypothetical protein